MAESESASTGLAPAAAMRHGPFSVFGIGVVAGIIVIDQLAKWLAETFLPFGRAVEVLPFLALYRTYNSGIAFSLLAGAGSLTLVLATAVISLAIILIWARSREGGVLAAAGYACILGGAIGNLIDRVAYGHVVDYLLLHYGDWTLFVFNLADAALTLGPVFLIASVIISPRST